MAFSVPTVPTYRDPYVSDPTLNTPLAQTSQFYAQNPWSDPGYQKYADRAGANAQDFFNSAKGLNTGFLSSPSSYLSAYGINMPDINNPAYRSQVAGYMKNLQGGEQNLLQTGVGQMAGAGVAAGRGGFGVTGTASPEQTAQQALIKQLAGQYSTDFGNSVNWADRGAQLGLSAAGQYGDALSRALSAYLGAGQGLMGDQLQGISGLDRSQQSWRDAAANAYGSDVNNYNSQVLNQDRTRQQRQQYQQQQTNQQMQQARQQNNAGSWADVVNNSQGMSWAPNYTKSLGLVNQYNMANGARNTTSHYIPYGSAGWTNGGTAVPYPQYQ